MAPPKRPTKPHRLEIRLEPEQYAELVKLAKKEKTNPTVYVRRLIEAALRKR